jgi:thiamine biosynthesis lipoprotein
MSTYLKNSELSTFNFSFDTGWHDVSKDLAFVINEAKRIGEKSGRFYDITVGPIVNLWGFGPEGVPLAVPIESSILKAKLRTGIEKLYVDLESSKIKKSIPDLYIDLSSIAKGFGVDRTSMLLENYGIKNYMVEIGGEVRTAGTNEKKKQWRIGISTPVDNQLQKIVSLSGVSIATSGDYLNYFEKQGIRYSHLIDPLTGRPISHNLASVSVIHKNCMIADAYATAINVMGTERGIDFAENEKLPVFMIVREGNKFIEKMTPEFKEYIDKGYNND